MAQEQEEKATNSLSSPVHIPEDDLRSTASASTGPDTQPLMDAPEYDHLPIGALLDQRQYEILAVISSNLKINVYVAEGNVAQRVCPDCGDNRNRPTDQFCTNCGADLAAIEVTRPLYLIKECADSSVFQIERQLAELKLEHSNIVSIRDAFSTTPYGSQARSYIVLDKVELIPLSQLPVPQEENKILKWGIQLAQALEYLHQHKVAHQRVKPENIVVDDDHARLTNFNVAALIPVVGETTVGPARYSEDLGSLVQMLHYLLTAQEQIGAVSVSPEWAKVFNRVVGPKEHRYHAAGELGDDLQEMLDRRQRPGSLSLRVGHLSDVGQVRSLNEDSLLTLGLNQVHESTSQPLGIYVVADGMGGHQEGEIASAMATRAIADHLIELLLVPAVRGEEVDLDQAETHLQETVQLANRQVHEHARSTVSNMGTTVVMALVAGDRAYIANVGDSRAYLLTDHDIQQITVDHSLIQRLIDTGQLTQEEAKNHPQRSTIYRVVGDQPKVNVDTFVQTLKPGERLLLCSDGLNGMVKDELIHQIVVTSPDPQIACAALVEAANSAGGEDNITVILLQLEVL